MTSPRPLLDSVGFLLARVAPALISLAVVRLPADETVAARYIEQLLLLAATLLAWNLAEGTFAVYLRAKERASAPTRGYLIVTFIFGFFVLALLGVFRSQASQGLFLILLAVLSLRGMSRVSWDQSRRRLAMATTVSAHSVLALLSLLCALGDLTWPTALLALGVGLAASSVELAWHAEELTPPATLRFAAPLFRVCLIGGPLIVASMAFTGLLPFLFSITYVAVLPGLRVIAALRRSGSALPQSVRPTLAVFALFVGIMAAVHTYGARVLGQ